MLQKESVKSRMDEGISFTEFTYMLVQAYDFAHLHREHGCELQLGGTDQWGNITAGIELVARQTGATVHGAVLPLLTTASGAKFGKSEGGNIWLDPAKTSPYQFYQFWLNSDDRDVERFLKTFTVMELDRIAELMAEQARDPGKRAAQRALATDVTARVHGAAAVDRVIAASEVVFGGREVRSLDRETLEIVAAEVPTKEVEYHVLAGGLGILDALHRAELTSSMADGRRGIQGASFSVNGTKVTKADLTLTEADLIDGTYIALQKGRKHLVLLRVAGRGAK
jgi:tyrosyl-tRNA synthetase